MSARLGDQIVQGRIDLLVRHGTGAAIVDHKSFPGPLAARDDRALSYAPQLGMYGSAVAAAAGIACDEFWVHMPVVGALLRVAHAQERHDPATARSASPARADGLRLDPARPALCPKGQ